mgnify:CR=1 FL=1
MSVGDAHELRATIADPAHDVSGTARTESEACSLARDGGIGEGSRVHVDGLQGKNTRIDHGDATNYSF